MISRSTMSLGASYVSHSSTERRYSIYSPALQLLAGTATTSSSAPPIAHEYIWFGGEPLAQVETTTGAVHWYFNDHLGAPVLTTSSTGSIDWRVEREPYGERYATRVGADRHQPLGLPGQEYDGSSDRQYNIFRWYRPGWGRYTQADPIGLKGGSHLYAYGGDAPLTHIDPLGLAYFAKRPLAGSPWIPLISCNPFYSFFNVEPSHEQLFFEDGQSPQNMGFFYDGSLKEEQPAVGYKCKSGKYDDCVMWEAVKQTGTAPYCLLGEGPNKKFNCQDWATLVREKYKQLAKEESVKKKCCKASSAGGS